MRKKTVRAFRYLVLKKIPKLGRHTVIDVCVYFSCLCEDHFESLTLRRRQFTLTFFTYLEMTEV